MLEDPEKQFYPIMAIPFRISQQLMYARKYVFAFHAILVQLCNIGLLSFGHQQLKEKDQVRLDLKWEMSSNVYCQETEWVI